MVDSTIVRAHPCATGAEKNGDQALGRSRGGFSTKIHVTVDALGNPLRLSLTAGQHLDQTEAIALVMGICFTIFVHRLEMNGAAAPRYWFYRVSQKRPFSSIIFTPKSI